MNTTEQCKETWLDGWNRRRCQRKAGPTGFCSAHSPEGKAKRIQDRDARWRRKEEMYEARRKAEQAMMELPRVVSEFLKYKDEHPYGNVSTEWIERLRSAVKACGDYA